MFYPIYLAVADCRIELQTPLLNCYSCKRGHWKKSVFFKEVSKSGPIRSYL